MGTPPAAEATPLAASTRNRPPDRVGIRDGRSANVARFGYRIGGRF